MVINVGDVLMDYVMGEDGNLTEELAIGYVVNKKHDNLYQISHYVVDWTDCGVEEYAADNKNIILWRKRYIDYEKNNRL